jgi:hypothetical protein
MHQNDGETRRQPEKSQPRRCLELAIAATAVVMIAAAPAAAQAAGEGSADRATPETVTEPPSGPAESPAPEAPTPPPTAPASSGWIPQGSGSTTSGNSAAPTQRGSSLGSGGAPNVPEPAAEEPSVVRESTGSSSYHQSESSTSSSPSTRSAPSTVEDPASTRQAGSRIGSVQPSPERTTHRGVAGLAAASPVSVPESAPVANVGFAPLAQVEPLASPSDPAGSGPGALLWLGLIVAGLIGVYAGGRVVLGPVEPFRR